MARLSKSSGLSAALALGFALASAGPALAQGDASTGGSSGGSSAAGTVKLGDKAPNGALMKTHGAWRSTSLVGATVYNDKGVSIGTVDDLLVSPDGGVQTVVISVGGFLGIGSKLVEAPFKSMRFAPSKFNPASGSQSAKQMGSPATTMSQPASANAAGASGASGAPGASGATGLSGSVSGAGVPSSVSSVGAANGLNSGRASPATLPTVTSHEYSLILPGATKASLTSDPAFRY